MNCNIVITGSNGFIARHLIKSLSSITGYHLFLISRQPNSIKSIYRHQSNVSCYSTKEFTQEIQSHSLKLQFDVIIHLAFAKSHFGTDYAQSLVYTKEILQLAKMMNVNSFINISSQSVYGVNQPAFWTESTMVSPNSMYSMAKYASEMLVDTYLLDTSVNWTNVRLSPVCENTGLISSFVKSVLDDHNIVIQNNYHYSYIDIKDVVSALRAMIDVCSSIIFNPIYNLGNNRMYCSTKIAERVRFIGAEKYKVSSEIIRKNDDDRIYAGMDSTLFCEDFDWTPRFFLDDMIYNTFNQEMKNEK